MENLNRAEEYAREAAEKINDFLADVPDPQSPIGVGVWWLQEIDPNTLQRAVDEIRTCGAIMGREGLWHLIASLQPQALRIIATEMFMES